MACAFLSLGSNLGDRLGHLSEAVRQLRERGVTPRRASSVYETAPVGRTEQPAFLNAVIEVETDLEPLALLAQTQAVENALGRRRVLRWGPRTLDIDILLYDDCRIDLPELQVPHPRMHERRFVLLPLVELQPDVVIPGIGPARACLDALDPQTQPARCLGAFPWP
ncbi:MAG: 2-amino-4-hydroxy-6-hydroxymethyldihydropteridine diphosphokinase [Armatimonadetes bacterium]|nr:2-amino-4-hydroxy-6-hydroxymethyldihydropteridine diphosphokinase [Armatimonadota bacterium]